MPPHRALSPEEIRQNLRRALVEVYTLLHANKQPWTMSWTEDVEEDDLTALVQIASTEDKKNVVLTYPHPEVMEKIIQSLQPQAEPAVLSTSSRPHKEDMEHENYTAEDNTAAETSDTELLMDTVDNTTDESQAFPQNDSVAEILEDLILEDMNTAASEETDEAALAAGEARSSESLGAEGPKYSDWKGVSITDYTVRFAVSSPDPFPRTSRWPAL